MKNYTITVNGNVYDVVVEEGASTGAPVAAAPKAPKAAPKAAANVAAGDFVIASPLPGVIKEINVKRHLFLNIIHQFFLLVD